MEKAEELAAHIKDYINTRISLLKLKFAEGLSKAISNITAIIIVSVFILLFIIFAGIAAALLIGEVTGSLYTGFLFVAGFFLLVGLICWWLREKLIRRHILNAIISKIHLDDDENKKESFDK